MHHAWCAAGDAWIRAGAAFGTTAFDGATVAEQVALQRAILAEKRAAADYAVAGDTEAARLAEDLARVGAVADSASKHPDTPMFAVIVTGPRARSVIWSESPAQQWRQPLECVPSQRAYATEIVDGDFGEFGQPGAISSVKVYEPSAATRPNRRDLSAKARLCEIIPAISSYNADNGTFLRMTVAGLQSTYDASLLPISVYRVRRLSDKSYCVQSTVRGSSWYQDGPSAPLSRGTCP